MLKRIIDLSLVFISLPVVLVLCVFIVILIKSTSRGPVLYWSNRVGINNQLFAMPKFRSMKINSPVIASEVLQKENSTSKFLTPVGSFIRKTSLDELPQLWSVIKGDMSIVGPRPALFNQYDLIDLRTKANVHLAKPGITGWAQINGRDQITLETKVKLDAFYIKHQSLKLDFYIMLLTFKKVIKREGVSH